MNPILDLATQKGFSLPAILKALSDPAVLAGIVQGIITGIMAIGAGVFTFISFLNERKRKNQTEFIQWLATLTEKYQGNSNYSKVRTILASKRVWVRRVLCLELLTDGLLNPDVDALEDDRDWLKANVAVADEHLDWEFLKNLTDYLYFFEQVLAFGISLKAINSRESARAIVNHFGWFLRSLCFAWADGDEMTRMKAACLFARYLAYNRYRRLAEVSLCFIETFASAEKNPSLRKQLLQSSEVEFRKVRTIFHENHGDHGFPISYLLLFRRWSPLVGSIGTIRH